MTSSTIRPWLSRLSPPGIFEYTRLYAPCLDVQRFQAMRLGGERSWVYDKGYCVDHLSSVDHCLKYWMYCDVRGALLPC